MVSLCMCVWMGGRKMGKVIISLRCVTGRINNAVKHIKRNVFVNSHNVSPAYCFPIALTSLLGLVICIIIISI